MSGLWGIWCPQWGLEMGTLVSNKDMDPNRSTLEDGRVSLTKTTNGGVSLTKIDDKVSPTQSENRVLLTKPNAAKNGAGTALKKDGTFQSVPRPAPPGRVRGSRTRLRVLTGATIVVLASSLTWVFTIRNDDVASTAGSTSETGPVPSGAPGGSSNPVAEPAPAQTNVPAPKTDTSGGITATDPASALNATTGESASQLLAASKEGAPQLQSLVGSWAPQVSSKCVGIPVDIEPRWIPDGVTDIQSVSIQQILAFNLSLKQRFGAVTVLPTQIGMSSDRPRVGACKGQTVWMSMVPKQFAHAADASRWCAVNIPPADECQPRFVSAARGV